MTSEQQALIERLYENESLTDNLTDTDAQALLKWAAEQIQNDADGELVTTALGNANQSGVAGAQALVTQASSFLTQALHARAQATHDDSSQRDANANSIAQNNVVSSAPVAPDKSITPQESSAPVAPNNNITPHESAASTPSTFGVQGASGMADAPRAQAQAALAPAKNPSAPKKRRAKRSKKK